MNQVAQPQTVAPAEAPQAMSRADLDGFLKRDHGYVEVNGKRVYFQSLTESERCKIDADLYDEDGELDEEAFNETRRSRYMAMALVDSSGKRLYKDEEWTVIAALNSRITIPIFEGLSKHLGLERKSSEEDEAKN